MNLSTNAKFLLAAAIAIAWAGFVQGAPSIKTWADILTVQNVFGLIGVTGGVVIAYFTKSGATALTDGAPKQ